MGDTLLLLTAVFYIPGLCNAGLAPFITKCKWDDSACAIESATKAVPIIAAGIPELGVETLDPMHIDQVNGSTPNVTFIVNDLILVGLTDSKIPKVQRDDKTSKILFTYVSTGKAEGNYELNGTLLNMTVSGKGKASITLTDAIFNFELDIVTKTDNNGKKHWHIKKFHSTYELPNESYVMFENLHQDSKVLGPAAVQYIETHGSELVQEIGDPVIRAVHNKIIENINHLFNAVPVEELSIE